MHLFRSFEPGQLTMDDHVLSGRLVPYNEVANVVDMLPDGTIDRYREAFDPGAFARQATSKERGVVNRITMRHLHDRADGLGFLGHASALRDMPDGLYGDVPIIASRVADVDGLIRNGVDGLSIEFHAPKGGTQERDGVRWRTRAVLWAVSLVPVGAFGSARVLSFRDDGADDDDDEDETTNDETTDETTDDGARPVQVGDSTGVATEDDKPDEDDEKKRAALDPAWLQQALQRQAELDAKYRPPVVPDHIREQEALHDAAMAAYHARQIG